MAGKPGLAITAGELRAFFTALSINGALPEVAPRLYGPARVNEREERAAMRRDAMLPDDVCPSRRRSSPFGRVLLTGARDSSGRSCSKRCSVSPTTCR